MKHKKCSKFHVLSFKKLVELQNLTITQAHQSLVNKEFSALELTKAYLDRIEKEDKKISSFLTVVPDLALEQAKKVDDLISKHSEITILAGIPFGIKDNILIEDIKCTAASKILENYVASYDATVVKKLKGRGAVILGKTNLDEFAMGSSTEYSAFGVTRNPNDLTRVPGGSSGGSAAAVAADLCLAALGSDTGGSIRHPASFCGVVGLKPTYGAVSRYGLIAMASSLDQIGPITKTVEDAKTVYEAITGKDDKDSTSVENQSLNHSITQSLSKLVIGVPKEYFIKGMDVEVEKIVREAIEKFEELGAEIEEISLPHTEYALPTYFLTVFSEVSSNLARYDGIKYGKSEIRNPKSKIQNLLDVYLQSREEGFGDEAKRRIMLGTYSLSAGYYEAYYKKAQKLRTLIKNDFENAFRKVQVILTPTSPSLPFKIGEKAADPLKMYLSDIFMVSVNLAGLPAISFPAGKSMGLPVGIQLIGKPFQESQILFLAKQFEQ